MLLYRQDSTYCGLSNIRFEALAGIDPKIHHTTELCPTPFSVEINLDVLVMFNNKLYKILLNLFYLKTNLI